MSDSLALKLLIAGAILVTLSCLLSIILWAQGGELVLWKMVVRLGLLSIVIFQITKIVRKA